MEQGFFQRHALTAAAAVVAAAVLLVYSNTFAVPFVFDDSNYIVSNLRVRSLENFLDLSGTRYVALLSFALNYAASADNTLGYHIVNTAVHLTNSLLVAALVLITLRTPAFAERPLDSRKGFYIALCSALIFAVHPVQTEAVTYISQRITSLATLFYLLSIIFYACSRLSQRVGAGAVFYVLSLASVVLAMKTKEIAFTLPFVIVLYELLLLHGGLRRKTILVLAPFVLMLAIIPLEVMRPWQSEPGFGPEEDVRLSQIADMASISPYYYFITQMRVLVTYFRLLVLPVAQNLDYDRPLFTTLFEPEVFLSMLFVAALVVSSVLLYMRSALSRDPYQKLCSLGIFWFFITISVESSIIPLRDVIFEHRLYLPSVGAVVAFTAAFFLLTDWINNRINERFGIRITAGAATCLLLIAVAAPLGAAAHMRNRVWRDNVTLWKDVAAKSPGKARAHQNLGFALARQGRTYAAISRYETALRIDPDYADAHGNLGFLLHDMGRIDEAVIHYNEALRVEPSFANARNNLGVAYLDKGLVDDAIEQFRLAVWLEPQQADAYNNLGNAYQRKGLKAEAIEFYSEALRIEPGHREAGLNLRYLGR